MKLRKVLENKEFRSLMEMKNLEEYRKVRQMEKLAQQQNCLS